MDFIFLIAGLIIGAIIGWLFAKSRFEKNRGIDPALFNQLDKDKSIAEQELRSLKSESDNLRSALDVNREKMYALTADIATWKNENLNLANKLRDQEQSMEKLHIQLKEQFENIANKVVHDNSQRIQQQHKEKLEDMLNPLKEKIEKFETRVKETHEERIREHQSLREQLGQIQLLNKSIGDEARNLTSALKGQSKMQGNWGELILEKILERSGLKKGNEYEVQSSMTNEDGRRLQPDVVIHLPENKHIVIDSKVSFTAFERYCNAETDELKVLMLKEHLISVRKHIKDLSGKNYQLLYHLNTLDFVLMFIPSEPAFSLAIENDPELFNDAFDRNIVIVTTSTLLATLRTIASIWKIEKQNINAMEIARQSGEMYDKFVGLVEDLVSLGKRLDSTKDAYSEAMKKLHSGRGNLVSKAEKIKQLGSNTSKALPQTLVERTEDIGELFDTKNES